MRARLPALVLLLLLPMLGCDGDFDITTPDEPQIVTGEWEGGNSLGFFEMVLAEDVGGRVSGSGVLVRSTGTRLAFDVTGANGFPKVGLTLRFGEEARADAAIGAQLLSYSAEFDQTDDDIELAGTLSGGALNRLGLRLERDLD